MYHGKPNWFELSTAPEQLATAGKFYTDLLGWQISDAGMAGFTYHLARHGGDMVAGLMEPPEDLAGMPPAWTIYFDVDDADAAASKIGAMGGKVLRDPADIPGTGRFAVVADPQGAVFGILQPAPMDPEPGVEAGAWNQTKESHGNWIELMSSDPDAGMEFYAELFGWTRSTVVEMPGMGTYQIFARDGADIGGMMGLRTAPGPVWMPYFGVNGVNAALDRIRGAGGEVLDGPHEVPGDAFVAMVRDPQGAHFAVVGPLEHTI